MVRKAKDENAIPEKSKLKKILNPAFVVIILLVVVIGVGGYLGYKKINNLEDQKNQLSDPQVAAQQESQRVKDAVSKLYEVPTGEDPTVASVVDASKLQDQAFFTNAQNGDKVLMYGQAKVAILYRPSTNKLVQVAPINIGNDQSAKTKSSSSPSLKSDGVKQ